MMGLFVFFVILLIIYFVIHRNVDGEAIGVGCGLFVLIIIIGVICKSCSCSSEEKEEEVILPPTPHIMEIQNTLNSLERRKGVGRGSGDTIQEAISQATVSAFMNAFGSTIDQTQILYDAEHLEDTLWSRNSAIIYNRTIMEYGEGIDGKYVVVEIEASKLPQTRPLKEFFDLGKQNTWDEKQQIVEYIKSTNNSSKISLSNIKGVGTSYEDAILNSIDTGICIAYGTFIETVQKFNNNELLKDQKIKFSNGYIEKYEEHNRHVNELGLCEVDSSLIVAPRGVQSFNLSNAVSNITDKTLEIREEINIENFAKELNNLKSVIPYLYNFKVNNFSVKSEEQGWYRRLINAKKYNVEFKVDVSVNTDAYYYKFLPRMLVVLNNISNCEPKFLGNIGEFSTNGYEFYYLDQIKEKYNISNSITLVDKSSELLDDFYAICFNLSYHTKNMYDEWIRQEFLDYEIELPIIVYDKHTGEQLESKIVKIPCEDILLKLVPERVEYKNILYNNIWAPFVGNAQNKLSFTFNESFIVNEDVVIESTVDLQQIARPKINMDLIYEAGSKLPK